MLKTWDKKLENVSKSIKNVNVHLLKAKKLVEQTNKQLFFSPRPLILSKLPNKTMHLSHFLTNQIGNTNKISKMVAKSTVFEVQKCNLPKNSISECHRAIHGT